MDKTKRKKKIKSGRASAFYPPERGRVSAVLKVNITAEDHKLVPVAKWAGAAGEFCKDLVGETVYFLMNAAGSITHISDKSNDLLPHA